MNNNGVFVIETNHRLMGRERNWRQLTSSQSIRNVHHDWMETIETDPLVTDDHQ